MTGIRVLTVLSVLAFFSHFGFAQPAEQVWLQYYGAAGWERFDSVDETFDGGYVLVGRTSSQGNGGQDIWLVKTDSEGNQQWDRTYGGSFVDECYRGYETSNYDGYLIAGALGTQTWGPDAWGIRTNTNGDTLWTVHIESPGDGAFWNVRELNDKGYIFVGWDYNPDRQALAVKTDEDGQVLWIRYFGGMGEEFFSGVAETSDNGYLFTGVTSTWGSGGRDMYVVKTDSMGIYQWHETYGGSDNDWLFSIEVLPDGNYVTVGTQYSSPAMYADACLLKIDESGNAIWTRLYGGSGYENGNQVTQTSDGGFMIAGETTTWGNGPRSAWMAKTDASGILEWHNTIMMPEEQCCHSGIPTADGDYVLAFYTEHDLYGDWDGCLVKLHNPEECIPQTVTIIPNELDFGIVDVGETDSRFIAVMNPDTCDLIITGASVSAPFTVDFDGPYTVQSGNNIAIEVFFAPQAALEYTATLRFYSNALDSPAEVPVSGIGGGPILLIVPDQLDFGEVQVGSTESRTLRLANIGTVGLTVSSIYVPQSFETNFAGPIVLSAGAETFVQVSFSPDTARHYEDILVIVSDLNPPTRVVVMTGIGIPLAADDFFAAAATEFDLKPVFPNPFNPSTTISFDVPTPADVSIAVYDITGREVAELINSPFGAGRHQLSWSCPECAAGVYLVTMTSGEYRAVTKALFVK
ncbi:choice-of-anchor D domain-containing protein [bacterium]|nr:choice-of-anchor D domain-containing protein [bacterium]